jgi:hypothetical protein
MVYLAWILTDIFRSKKIIMTFDADALTEIVRLKAALEADSPQRIYSRPEVLQLIALLQQATGSARTDQGNLKIALVEGTYSQLNRFSGINGSSDVLIGSQKIYKINFNNRSASELFLQFHNSATGLISGESIPFPEIYSAVASTGYVHLFPSDFSIRGLSYGVNTRVAVSTTPYLYTAPQSMANTALNIEAAI